MSTQLVPLDANLAIPIAVQQPVLLVGRHPEADVRLTAAPVSRRHCCLAVVDDRVLVRDLGSRHGVFVNGVRVEEAPLNPGDEVAIAHLIYRLEVIRPVPPAVTAVTAPPPGRPAPAPSPVPAPVPSPELEFSDDDLIPLDE